MRNIIILAVLSLLAACAGNPKISEVKKDTKSVSYLQYGTGPLSYSFGVVDGASYWAKGLSNINTAGLSSLDQGIVSIAGVAASETSDVNARQYSQTVIGGMLVGIDIVGRVRSEVMPAFAARWEIPYNTKLIRLRKPDSPLMDEKENLAGIDPGTDLLIAFYVDNINLTLKPTVGGAFADLFTFGTSDKEVAPEIRTFFKVFKRDPDTKKMRTAWSGACMLPVIQAPTSIAFSKVKDTPLMGKDVMRGAVETFVKNCKESFTNLD